MKPDSDFPSLKKPDNRAELVGVLVALGVYLSFQLHALAFHGYWGQDWITHRIWIMQAAANPWKFFAHYDQGRTNPPLYHLLAGAVKRLVGGPDAMPAVGLMNVIFGFVGACFTYGVIRRLIASPVLRVAALVCVLFLPFAMIHAEVVSADALATPLFWALLWLMVRFPASGSRKMFLAAVVSIALLLVAGLYVKFTFGSFLIAVLIWIGLLWWTRLISGQRLAAVVLLIVGVPALVGYGESVRFRSQQKIPWLLESPSINLLLNGSMNLRSIVWLRSADVDLLSAPPYNRKIEGQYELFVSNKHSLPSLMHLAMFTDILNVYQFDPYDQYFGSRTLRSYRRMEVAVRSGIVLSLLAVIGVAVTLFTSARGVALRQGPRDLHLLTMLVCCGGWLASIVVMLPFLPGAYEEGYWLPRLVAPALIGFFIAGFALVDRARWNKAHVAVLVFVVAQSAMHLSFLWPTKTSRPLYDANADIASTQEPVLRVFNWPDQYVDNPTGAYWLDKTIGLVVNLPERTKTKEWRLSLTLTPGPANPESHGLVRISAKDLAPALIEFDRANSVKLEVPLAGGRNDIVIERVAPALVPETPGNPVALAIQVSKITFTGPDGESPKLALP